MADSFPKRPLRYLGWIILRIFLTLVGVVLGGFVGLMVSGVCFG